MANQPQAPAQEPKKSIFSSKEEPSSNIVSDIAGQVNNVSRSVKQLEDRYTTLHKKSQVTEQNMLNNDKKIISDIKVISSELLDLKSEMADIKDKLTLLVKELKLSATKEEVKVLEKYISYWEPLSFVTRQELNKFLGEREKL